MPYDDAYYDLDYKCSLLESRIIDLEKTVEKLEKELQNGRTTDK